MSVPRYEIRLNDDGSLDEVVATAPTHVHLEQMADDAWWLRIDMPDGRAVVVNLWTQKRAHIKALAETEA